MVLIYKIYTTRGMNLQSCSDESDDYILKTEEIGIGELNTCNSSKSAFTGVKRKRKGVV
jgi:hypothetical protein